MLHYEELISYINQYKKVIVAFSGGIDSYFVLKATIDSLGSENVLAVTADSPSLKDSEKDETKKLAVLIGANHKIIFTQELDNPDYYNNPNNRCFFCKDELYTKLDSLKAELGYDAILDGTNYDDMSDYRPGYKASRNHSIISPLIELKFTKHEIRSISKELGLEIWDKPSSPCLSSRIPYGQKVTLEKLSLIEQAEEILKSYGFREFRVRHFEFDKPGTADKKLLLAKLDISHEEIEEYLSPALLDELNQRLKELGYDFVTLDMGGLKSGSLSEIIVSAKKK
jgi:uncharacterized protein